MTWSVLYLRFWIRASEIQTKNGHFWQIWPFLRNIKWDFCCPKQNMVTFFCCQQFSSVQWYQIMLWFALHSELFLHLMHFLNMHNYTVLCMYIGYDEEYVLRCTLEERCPVIGEVQLGQKLYPPNRPLSPPAVWANRGFFFGENLQNLQNIHISDGNCSSGMLWLRPHTFWPHWKVLRPEHLSRRVAEEENRGLTLRTLPPPIIKPQLGL